MAIKYKDMAIDYKQMKAKLAKAPLDEEELKLVAEAEEYIDKEIKKQFGSTYGVSIDLVIPSFNYSPKAKKPLYDIKDARKDKMQNELERRYKKAGWKITVHLDDGLDGPNMSGPDLWILTGK